MPVGASGSAPDAAGLDARIQAGLTSPNLQVRKWAQDTMRLRLSQTGGRSAPVPTQDGYAYLDSDGTTKYLTGKGGNPLMPVSALAQDPSRQGEIAQAKKVGGNEADRLLAGQNAAKQNEEAAMLIDQAIGVLPQASSGSFSGGVTMMANAAGISTDASKADAELRLLAGRLTAQQPRFEGPQSDKDIQAYREMAGDLANPNLPIETRLVTARKMKALLDKYGPDGRLKPEPPSGDTQNGGNRPSLSDIF